MKQTLPPSKHQQGLTSPGQSAAPSLASLSEGLESPGAADSRQHFHSWILQTGTEGGEGGHPWQRVTRPPQSHIA